MTACSPVAVAVGAVVEVELELGDFEVVGLDAAFEAHPAAPIPTQAVATRAAVRDSRSRDFSQVRERDMWHGTPCGAIIGNGPFENAYRPCRDRASPVGRPRVVASHRGSGEGVVCREGVPFRRVCRGVRLHDRGRASRREDGSPSRVVERLQPRARRPEHPRRWWRDRTRPGFGGLGGAGRRSLQLARRS